MSELHALKHVVICIDEHSKRHKRNMILKALSATPPDVATLRQLAISRGGLLDDTLRKRAWPCLLDIDVKSIPPKPGEIVLTSVTVSILCGYLILRASRDVTASAWFAMQRAVLVIHLSVRSSVPSQLLTTHYCPLKLNP